MKLMTGFDSNYRYILVAARRARQIQNGAHPTIDTQTKKSCRIAEEEVKAGNIQWYIPEKKTAAEIAKEQLDQAIPDA
ncbi:DNA-directed RNA polymerase, omega subunit [Candidatus Koribacter versatilis Ellin345]|uniref:DNA-directed RNA polymerase subunit omega n=1 Tax=Koribacter versatilis (strain Ellin345) TaxID=204669 RepID=Q1IK23_KORVE|nr:DNA-directed RNA polymerase subunit omega [Candidatus Koribacter versatilis]ABF42777.1 DNA-directed RNA polymerase, omega subunit [Candidatus Koribacter versatilis Ellin345]